MNKKVFGRKLSRSRPSREALFASLAISLIKNGKIVTTKAKAKAVVPYIEKIVTLAKKNNLSGRRDVFSRLDNSKEASELLFSEIIKAFSVKNSGFTRIISLPRRHGDNAEMVRLEWTEKIEFEPKKKDKENKDSKPVKSVKKSEKKEVVKKEVKKKEGK